MNSARCVPRDARWSRGVIEKSADMLGVRRNQNAGDCLHERHPPQRWSMGRRCSAQALSAVCLGPWL
jgi:hypothetical protein